MSRVDAPGELRQWFADWEPRWRALAIGAALNLPQEHELNKAVATLETTARVASVTAWGEGTLEYIVLDIATGSEAIMWDKQYSTAAELRLLLDECAESFAKLTGA